MGFLSHRVERSDLETGDHIYTWRTAFSYSHHGIYVGEDRVVHFTQAHNWSSCNNSSSTCFSNLAFCGFKKGNSGVTNSCLNCFMGNDSLHRYEYGVGRCAFIAKRGGTCTTAESDDPESAIHRAMYLLYNGFGEYKLFRNNCEDFALYCKTGLLVSRKRKGVGSSGQVSAAVGVSGAVLGSLAVGVIWSNPVALGAATAVSGVSYTYDRYNKDIGVRSDVVKVDVEGIEAFLGDE